MPKFLLDNQLFDYSTNKYVGAKDWLQLAIDRYLNLKLMDLSIFVNGISLYHFFVFRGNTDYLKNVMFNIDSKSYVNNILTLLGNVNGTSFGSFGHEMSNILTELFPFIKKPILKNVGKTIAQSYMQNYQAEKNKYNI